MHSIHEIPLVGIVIPFGIGILIGDYTHLDSNSCLVPIASLMIILGIMRWMTYEFRVQFFYPVSFLIITLLGLTYMDAIDEFYDISDVAVFEEYGFSGSVSNVKRSEGKVNCEFSIDSYFNQDSIVQKSFSTQLFIAVTNKEIKNGDKLTVHGKLTSISKNTNPYTFDYKNYLRHKYIYHQISISEDAILSHSVNVGWQFLPVRLNNYAQDVLKKYACCKETAGIAIGMLTGDKNEISKELLETYSRVGTMHLLAVSGLHVGIVSTFLFWLFSFKPSLKNNLFVIAFIISVIWAFVLFTGAKASTCRAGLMFTLLFGSRLLKQTYNPYNIIACSALILLIINPHALFDLGFQLSYLAVVSIIFFYPHIYELIDYRKLNKLTRGAWSLICLSISANLLIIPISAFYFHQVSLSFVLSNLIAVPSATVIVVGGFVLVVIDLLSTGLSSAFASLYFMLITGMNEALRLVDQIPHLIIENIQLDKVQLITVYVIIATIMIVVAKEQLRLFRYSLGCLFLLITYSSFSIKQEVKFTIYDIYGKTVVDYTAGNKVFHFTNDSLSLKSIQYNIEPNRLASNIRDIISLNSTNYNSKELIKSRNLFVFSDKLFFIPQTKEELEHIPYEVDYLIINHTRGVNKLNVDKRTKVIFTNNKYLNRWKIDLPEHQIIRISKHGAYSEILNDV